MGYKIKFVKTASHEAHELAGHPKAHAEHLLGPRNVGVAVGVSTASGVGTYQINRKIAKHQGDTVPVPSPTNAPVGAGEAVSHGATAVHHGAIHSVHNAHRRYNQHKGGY